MSETKPEHVLLMVAERPYAVWDWDITAKNLEFIRGVDPKYFDHVGKINAPALETEEKKYAALSIRMAYSQALETFFALLFAAIQAPNAMYGWVPLYRMQDLRSLVDSIRLGRPINAPFFPRPASWDDVARLIFDSVKFGGDDELDKRIKEHFAQLWRRFAHDFTDGAHSDEYNSIKHGLRVRNGGFHFAMAMEDKPGEPAPADRWKSLGGSDFGSAFYTIEQLSGEPNKHNIRGTASMHNWNPENHLNGLSLLSVSLQNVLNFALAHNGVTEKLEYFYPAEDHAWDSPWVNHIGVTSMSAMEYVLREEHITPFSRDQIRKIFEDAYVKYERGEGKTQLAKASAKASSEERKSD